jgi:hypothetical protein
MPGAGVPDGDARLRGRRGSEQARRARHRRSAAGLRADRAVHHRDLRAGLEEEARRRPPPATPPAARRSPRARARSAPPTAPRRKRSRRPPRRSRREWQRLIGPRVDDIVAMAERDRRPGRVPRALSELLDVEPPKELVDALARAASPRNLTGRTDRTRPLMTLAVSFDLKPKEALKFFRARASSLVRLAGRVAAGARRGVHGGEDDGRRSPRRRARRGRQGHRRGPIAAGVLEGAEAAPGRGGMVGQGGDGRPAHRRDVSSCSSAARAACARSSGEHADRLRGRRLGADPGDEGRGAVPDVRRDRRQPHAPAASRVGRHGAAGRRSLVGHAHAAERLELPLLEDPALEAPGRSDGQGGPDKAPPSPTREYTNPRTGEISRVPVGIDPGFAYNPGKSRLEHLQLSGAVRSEAEGTSAMAVEKQVPDRRPARRARRSGACSVTSRSAAMGRCSASSGAS